MSLSYFHEWVCSNIDKSISIRIMVRRIVDMRATDVRFSGVGDGTNCIYSLRTSRDRHPHSFYLGECNPPPVALDILSISDHYRQDLTDILVMSYL